MMEILDIELKQDVMTGASSYHINYTHDDEHKSIVVPDDHVNIDEIRDLIEELVAVASYDLTDEDVVEDIMEQIIELYDVSNTVADKIGNILTELPGLDGRLTISGSSVYMDCEPIDPTLEHYIIRLLHEKKTDDSETWGALIRFIEKLYANPDADVRRQLYGWLDYMNNSTSGFTLTTSGNLVGYKGCGGTVEEPRSINRGTAFVDGVKFTGEIPNRIGSVVTMPRSDVENNPAVGCSAGLHVGTYDYASGWAHGVLLTVEVNPRDIVSIPTECNAQKMRVSRYKVVDVCDGPDNSVVRDYDDEWDDYYNDEEECCGGYCEDCPEAQAREAAEDNCGSCCASKETLNASTSVTLTVTDADGNVTKKKVLLGDIFPFLKN